MSRVVGVLLALATAIAVGWVALWWWAPTGSRLAFVVLALTPVATVIALVVAILTLATRRRLLGAVGLVAALVLVGVVAPRAIPDDGASSLGRGRLIVATANLEFGGVDPAALVDVVRSERVDVLSLQELTPTAERDLAAAGLFADLPFRVTRPRTDAGGIGLVSRLPLGPSPVVPAPSAFEQVAGRVETGSVPVDVLATHPEAPAFDGPASSRWSDEITALPGARGPGDLPLVVAGDLNATLDHRPLREVLARGTVDAAAATGAGLSFTWPTDQPVPPFAAIDHVLLSGEVVATTVHTRRLAGTDHAALVAVLGVGPSASAD